MGFISLSLSAVHNNYSEFSINSLPSVVNKNVVSSLESELDETVFFFIFLFVDGWLLGLGSNGDDDDEDEDEDGDGDEDGDNDDWLFFNLSCLLI